MLKKLSLAVAVAVGIAALLWAVRAPGAEAPKQIDPAAVPAPGLSSGRPAPPGALADSAGAWQAYQTGKYASVAKELAALAEAGDANAQYYLGTLYSDGLAVKRDYRKAVEWYGKAAAKGHGDAEFTLGFLYLSGAGEGAGAVPADTQLAAKWLKAAAGKGNVAAQSALATIYGEGYGVTPDPTESLRWAPVAAERGDAAAQYEMGRLKTQSLVVESWGEAYTWFRLAEKQGYPGANESRMAVGKQLDPKALAEAERRADMFMPRK